MRHWKNGKILQKPYSKRGDNMGKFIIGLFMGGVVGFMTMAIITIGKGGE